MALVGIELESLVSDLDALTTRFWKFRPSGDSLPFSDGMNGWSDSVLFKLVKNWQFSGNISLKMNVLSIKRLRFTDLYPLPKQQNTNKTGPFHKRVLT